jgi:hypothetical protein
VQDANEADGCPVSDHEWVMTGAAN